MLAKLLSKSETLTQLLGLFAFYQTLDIKRRFFVLSILFSILATFCNVLSLRLLVPFIHSIISNDSSALHFFQSLNKFSAFFFESRLGQIVLLAIIILAFSILKNFSEYLASNLGTKQAAQADKAIKNLIFKKYLGYGKLFFDQKSIGELSNILLSSSTSISSQLIVLQKILGRIFALIGYLTVLFYISVKLTLGAIVILPLSHFLVFKTSKKIKNKSRKLAEKQSNVSKSLIELLFCIPLIQTFGKEKEQLAHFRKQTNAYLRSHFSIVNLENFLPPIRDLVSTCALISIALALPFVEPLPCSTARASELILFFLILRISMPSVNALHDLHNTIAKTSGAMRKINTILNGKQNWLVSNGNTNFKKLNQGISFRNLDFKLSNRHILKKITLDIKKGTRVGIVGESGAGKTILVNLLLRFYDVQSNRLFIDGTDIKKFNIKSLRSKIGYISQDVILFDNTLRENILYGRRQSDNHEMQTELDQVISKTKLATLIKQLPDGLETQIGLAGKLISGGERTKVAIARTLLLNSEILIFDEASSSLDNVSEEEIRKVIEELTKNKTSIHIIHRLKNFDFFDKIVVLEAGRIVEEGSPRELLEKKGAFYNYWIKEHSQAICPECGKVHGLGAQ